MWQTSNLLNTNWEFFCFHDIHQKCIFAQPLAKICQYRMERCQYRKSFFFWIDIFFFLLIVKVISIGFETCVNKKPDGWLRPFSHCGSCGTHREATSYCFRLISFPSVCVALRQVKIWQITDDWWCTLTSSTSWYNRIHDGTAHQGRDEWRRDMGAYRPLPASSNSSRKWLRR